MNIYEALKYYYNYDEYRPNQDLIVKSLLNKENTIAILPTGGGKSVCFQIPALLSEGLCIVITPLISLMNDQVYELQKINVKATLINSTMDKKEINEIYNNLDKYTFLYLSPERLENITFLEKIKDVKLSYIIIDEAHCIQTWGSNFRTSYQRINNFINNKDVTIGCFTATTTKYTLNKITTLLNLNKYNLFQNSLTRENLLFKIIKTNNKFNMLKTFLSLNGVKIIYCSTVKTVEYLYNLLKDKYNITYYHGRLDQYNRNLNQNNFIKGKIDIIIATNAFGMGINKSDVRYVIHYEVSSSLEDYYQEAGRAGRDSKSSRCIILYDKNDLNVHYYQRDCLDDIKSINKKTDELRSLKNFLNTSKCLEVNIKNYFNEDGSDCNRCFNCLNKNKRIDISELLIDFENINLNYNITKNNLFLIEEYFLLIKNKYKKYKLFILMNKCYIKLSYDKTKYKKLINLNKEIYKKEKIKVLTTDIIIKLICLNPYNYSSLTKNNKKLDLMNKYKKDINNIINLEKKAL